MGKMKRKMLMIALAGVIALAWNTQALAGSISFSVDSTGILLDDGSYIVNDATVFTLTAEDYASPNWCGIRFISAHLRSGAYRVEKYNPMMSYGNLPSGSLSWAFSDYATVYPEGTYVINGFYCEGGSYIFHYIPAVTVHLYNGDVLLDVGSPSVLNADGSYNITSATPLTVSNADPRLALLRVLLCRNDSVGTVIGEWDYVYGSPSLTFYCDTLANGTFIADGTYKIYYHTLYYPEPGATWVYGPSHYQVITLDNTPPEITILHPTDGATLNSAVVTVAADVSDVSDVVVTAAINPVVLDYDPNTEEFSGQVLHTLQDFTIMVTATDVFGHENVEEVTVKTQHDQGLHRGHQK